MEKDSPTFPPVLGYEKPQAPTRLFSPKFVRWAVGSLVLLAVGMGAVVAGYPEVLMGAMLLLPFVIVAAVLAYAIRAMRKARSNEKNEETVWEERQQKHEEMLEIAQQIYAKGPVGCWRIMYGFQHSLGGPTIQEKRLIEFQADGKGIFRAFDAGGLENLVNVAFEYKLVAPHRLTVRMTQPPAEEWHEVEFGFEIDTWRGEPDLLLWLESKNPMPEGAREFWPFCGEFLREQ